jgi:microcystin-dependent protein
MGEPFVGEVRIFAGTFAPAGWAMCQGQLMPISQNDTLFNLIGTTYGGDGQETFALPDLQGRLPIHAGQGPGISQTYQLGEKGGSESVTLTTQQIPIHNHAMLASSAVGQQPQPQNAFLAQTSVGFPYVAASTPHVNLNNNSLGPVGGNQPHENCMPFLVLTFIISLFGVFPTQN